MFCNFFKEKRGCGEWWLAGCFFFYFSWFSGSSDPGSAAACAVETQFSIFGVALEKGVVIACMSESFGNMFHSFRCSFPELDF